MRTIQSATLALSSVLLLAGLAQAAEPDTTAAEPLRRPRPTASAPT